MVINKYAKKILITREHDRADARVKREIGTGNIKDVRGKKKRECRGEILSVPDDEGQTKIKTRKT